MKYFYAEFSLKWSHGNCCLWPLCAKNCVMYKWCQYQSCWWPGDSTSPGHQQDLILMNFTEKHLGTVQLSFKKCTGMVKLPWQPLIDFWVYPSNVCLWLVTAHDGSHPTVERVVSRFRVYVTRHAILETNFHPTDGFKQKGKVERVKFLLVKLVRWKELISCYLWRGLIELEVHSLFYLLRVR